MITKNSHSRKNCRIESRRGAIAALTAFVLVALLSVSALVVSLSYLEMAGAELQLATDAAARSGVIQLTVSQSESSAKSAARDIAGRHRVGGSAFSIH